MAKKKKQENQKDNLKKIEKAGSFDSDIWGKVFIVLGILCFLCAFYLLTIYITNKNSTDTTSNDKKEAEETVISYDEIMVGRSLDMSDGDYFVLYYDMSDENISGTYSSLVSGYKSKEDHLNIYVVDMSSSFNKPYATDKESNKNPSKASEILVNGPTLIKVSNKQVSDYVEGEESITNYLK